MKTKTKRPIVSAVASAVGLFLGLSPSPACAQTNLVANGSFEAGPVGEGKFTNWDLLGPANNFSNYGVAQSGTYPDVAEQGNYYAYFRGHPTDNSQDCLGTTVKLKVGALYNISYYLPYQKFSTSYLAATASPILSFHGINATNGRAATSVILLDNVSMTLTYPPLNLSSSPPNLVFSWPFTNSPYRLQATALITATNWVTLTNVPVNIGTNNQVVLPVHASQQFYRLTLP